MHKKPLVFFKKLTSKKVNGYFPETGSCLLCCCCVGTIRIGTYPIPGLGVSLGIIIPCILCNLATLFKIYIFLLCYNISTCSSETSHARVKSGSPAVLELKLAVEYDSKLSTRKREQSSISGPS